MYNVPFHPKKILSHALILICGIVSVIGFMFPNFNFLYSLHSGIHNVNFEVILLQSVLFQFLHGGIFHLFLNSYFLYSAGPEMEARISRNGFVAFFIFSTVFIVIAILMLENPGTRTLGISGFCNAILAYLTLDLYSTKHPMANSFGFMLVINIAIGFLGGISFIGHFFGSLAWIIWFIGTKVHTFKNN